MPDSLVVPRPTFHFTPRRNWMNDPNGLVYDHGRWHLYYQVHFYASDDLRSWEHASVSNLVPLGRGPIGVTVGTERPGAIAYTAVDVEGEESAPDASSIPLHALHDLPATAP
ncbi:hypothetical protein G5C66_17375 [Nocardioides sp. KC13]|uniref:Glycosyl hydrolase family 32 N-terminal domain-containing protein n=1 Tax=Nocardioides turkmenicus TaxID=2711220 RepID=A0A6M1QWZ9_9ACTN|nr:hypothetical protein [Nocardioides sp. KC13]NGN94503.1 hypothetical protein [Nocardioides sp. KC13]